MTNSMSGNPLLDMLGKMHEVRRIQNKVREFMDEMTKDSEASVAGFLIACVNKKLEGGELPLANPLVMEDHVSIKTDAGAEVDRMIRCRILHLFRELKLVADFVGITIDFSELDELLADKPADSENTDGAYIKYRMLRELLVSLGEHDGIDVDQKHLIEMVKAADEAFDVPFVNPFKPKSDIVVVETPKVIGVKNKVG